MNKDFGSKASSMLWRSIFAFEQLVVACCTYLLVIGAILLSITALGSSAELPFVTLTGQTGTESPNSVNEAIKRYSQQSLVYRSFEDYAMGRAEFILRAMGKSLEVPPIATAWEEKFVERDGLLYQHFAQVPISARIQFVVEFTDKTKAVAGNAVVVSGKFVSKQIYNPANGKLIAQFTKTTEKAYFAKLMHWNGAFLTQGNYQGELCMDKHRQVFNLNGKVSLFESLTNGLNHGEKLEYNAVGVLVKRSNYNFGTLDGFSSEVLSNNQFYIGQYKSGKKVGNWTRKEGARLLELETFDNEGQLVGSRKY